MNTRESLAREILEQLRFYHSLGVRWSRAKRPATGRVILELESRTQAPKGNSAVDREISEKGLADASYLQRRPGFGSLPQEYESLEAIRADLGDCQRCKLAPLRTNIVFGSGNSKAELMFVGEAPGADEDRQGLPFVGRAGQLLTKIIEAMGMRREEVYICNILKCRPPENQNPEPDEIAQCEPFLARQIASVRPKVICTLGAFGTQTLLKTKDPISKLRGRFIEYQGAKLMPTFHPAYLLRNPGEKRKVWEDAQKIRDYLKSLHA